MSETGKQVLTVGNGVKFTLTIESNNLGDIVDLFDPSRIHRQQPSQSFTHETPESLMEGMDMEPEAPAPKPEPKPAPQPEPKKEPAITMETLKHMAVQVSERLGTKKVVGEAIKSKFGCRMPELREDQYAEALKVLEDLNNA